VGPPGEEIYCDEWGRVKVSFPWDRESQNNEFSSCWVRVSQGWAGGSWGSMAIPRIGQDVIIQYVNGDPDQPMITGRTYCGDQLPPYDLPDHKTRMTIKSQTHKGKGFNELRFEDELGKQEVFIHAEKDQNNVVKNNESTVVGNDRNEEVVNNETLKIGNNRYCHIERNDENNVGNDKIQRTNQDYIRQTGRNYESITQKNKTDTVGNDRHEKTKNNHHTLTEGNTIHHTLGKLTLKADHEIEQLTQHLKVSAGQSITLQSPGGRITLDDSGVSIEGLSITIKGEISVPCDGRGDISWIGDGKPATGSLEAFFFLESAESGEPLIGHPYEIRRESGHIFRGITDGNGRTQTVISAETEIINAQALHNPDDTLIIEASYWDSFSVADLDFAKT
ncbi:type VI secretion protein VgrG, partial [Pseudomonas sp. 250J]